MVIREASVRVTERDRAGATGVLVIDGKRGERRGSWPFGLLVLIVAGTACAGSGGGTSGPPRTSSVSAAATPSAEPSPSGPTVNYVAFGDSDTAGYLASEGYPELFGRALQAAIGRPVSVDNLGMLGWTSENLLHALETNASFRRALDGADVVTVEIGGNDLDTALSNSVLTPCSPCIQRTLDRFESTFHEILRLIVRARDPSRVLIRAGTVYDLPALYADEGVGKLAVGAFAQMNAFICHAATAVHVACADFALALNGPAGVRQPSDRLLARDHSHLSDAGQAVESKVLVDLGFAPLA